MAAIWVSFAVLALAAAGRGVRWVRAQFMLPTQRAEWIWAPEVTEHGNPVAFFAVRDFPLSDVPAEARLLISADEEFLAYVNGKWAGSGRYGSRASLAELDVAALLESGLNRLAILARSGRGAGGLLASLSIGESPPVVVTDGSWQIILRHHAGLVEGLRPLGAGPGPQVWQVPPTGRWGAPTTVSRRSVVDTKGQAFEWAASFVEIDEAPCDRLRPAGSSSFLIDFGRTMSGYLEAWIDGETGAYPVLFGLETPPDGDRPSDLTAIPLRSSGVWRDAALRRFRYVLVHGVENVTAARVHLVADGTIGPTPTPSPSKQGLWGLEPPGDHPDRAPCEGAS